MKKSTIFIILQALIVVAMLLLLALYIAPLYIENNFLESNRRLFSSGIMAGFCVALILSYYRKEKAKRKTYEFVLLTTFAVVIFVNFSLQITHLIGYLVGLACCVCN